VLAVAVEEAVAVEQPPSSYGRRLPVE